MKVIDIVDHGKNSKLILTKKTIPDPKAGEVLIEVQASGVNRPDILQRYGLHPPPEGSPDHPGLEVSGTISEVGSGVNKFKKGDKVIALLGGGGYAEYCLANQELTLPMPENLSFVEAAAIPETYFTVWNNLFRIGKLKPNENVLIHGGSSGIGTTAIQISKEFGANVITTTSNEDKRNRCYEIGADLVVNYSNQDFYEEIKNSSYKEIDVTLDIVGGEYTNKNYALSAMNARIIQIAYLKGHLCNIDLSQIMRKSLSHTGSVLRPKNLEYKAKIANDIELKILPLLNVGKIKPIIFKSYFLDDAERAHDLMKSGEHFGKIILTRK
ncbi:MAG: zinc-binding dehydrogenase [Rhodobiaceae bacterium]|nr:zinc-binding dehydrogenase [Rhodobiaceae bacterium]|tara:strand:- start:4146 stop:5123 length:978 start_codon:yes stop_codon:yes gene_type:complete